MTKSLKRLFTFLALSACFTFLHAQQSDAEIQGKTITNELQVITTPTAGHVLTSDAMGNATWQAPTTGSTVDPDWIISGTNMYSGVSDNVGIGVTNPTKKLQVTGGNGIGVNGSTLHGVFSDMNAGAGFYATANADNGMRTSLNTGVGIYSDNNTLQGFLATNNTLNGLIANSNSASGVSSNSNTGYGFVASGNTTGSAFLTGDVQIVGNLTKSGGTFKIDHPLDPENKYLYHSFVESPEMMNVYNGNVILDEDGTATVEMEDWFEALNMQFRYQLTCLGGFAPVYISEKMNGNKFKIAGGTPEMEVSWQVTGVRQDPYAVQNRVQVEVEKEDKFKGRYLHPEVYGQPASKSHSHIVK